MARDFGDGKVEGVDFEMVPSNAKDSKGNPVLTRRFFTRSEKAERAKPKAEPKPAPKAAPKAAPKPAPKPKPKAEPKPAGGARPTVGGAGGMPRAPRATNPQYDRPGPAGGKPKPTPKPLSNSGNPQYDRDTTAPGGARPTVGSPGRMPAAFRKPVPGRALWLALTGGGNPKNYMDAAKSGNPQYARGGKVAKKPTAKKPKGK